MIPRIRVDIRSVLHIVGQLLRWFSVTLMVPICTALLYGESPTSFLVTLLAVLLTGTVLVQFCDHPELGVREGFLVVALSWLVVSLFGAMPYVLEGNGTVATPLNAFFESMSGFTTTGSTVMASIGFETHSRALLLWRQLTQWLGGMGIIVLAVAILPRLSVGGAQLMQAEAPGPDLEKLTPHIARTARFLWILYVSFTVLEMSLLHGAHLFGFAPGMTLYQSIAHAFTTMPTGGFSPEGRSIEAFSSVVQWIIIPFMFIAGINFALIWHTATDRLRRLVEDPEWQFYAFSVGVVATLLTGGLVLTETVPEWGWHTIETQVRHGLFQALAIVTTTGYASTDYVQWSTAGQMVLLVAMFIGGCAGSTGGSVKIVRWLVVLKSMLNEVFKTLHPDAVQPIRLGDRVLDRDAVRGIFMFIFLYIFVFVTGTAIIVVDCQLHALSCTPLELLGTAATSVGNVGPSFGQVGPMANFTELPAPSRLTMAILMWMGRLELITVLVLLTPAYWFS